MIISLHLPKTAGTSFGKSLEEHFRNSLLKDYADWPMNAPPYERNLKALRACIDNGEKDFTDVECIHGHFLPLKYLLLSLKKEITFITWMRDPVERLASHYRFWQKTYEPHTSQRLHKRAIEEEWSLERFCLGPELQNFYSLYLWGFPLETFDFIGIVEHYEDEFAYFSNTFLKTVLAVHRENLGDRATRETPHLTDKDFRKAVEVHHGLDMALYKRALEMRISRIKSAVIK